MRKVTLAEISIAERWSRSVPKGNETMVGFNLSREDPSLWKLNKATLMFPQDGLVTVPQQKRILTMNRGSATLKSALYETGDREEPLLTMTVDQAGASGGHLRITNPSGTALLDSPIDLGDPNAALEAMFAWLGEHGFLSQLSAAGHRLVHGGARYRDPQRVTPEFLSEIEQLVPLDPDHMPAAAIRGIQFVAGKFPELPQVACFDTAFHRSLPKVARMYAPCLDASTTRACFGMASTAFHMST